MHRRVEPGFMWLRDRLPHDVTGIRSIIYGYDTSLLASESFQTIEDIARSFIARLRTIGYASSPHRPLVFLAHSLGGIILKRALLYLANSGDAHTCILNRVRAVILFGVPNRGMKTSHLLSMTADRPNTALIQTLSPESPYLPELDELFTGIASTHNLRILSVYETSRSRTTTVSAQLPNRL
jgi:alpha-beta hydrolase superfamily lysophospholipase